MKRLSNADLSKLEKDIKDYREKVLDAFYDYYQKVVSFMDSGSMKGSAGDAVFSYYGEVHLYLINKTMNVVSEISEEVSRIKDEFLSYEETADGLVDSSVVEEKRERVRQVFRDFEAHETRLKNVESQIMGIAGVTTTDTDSVVAKFSSTDTIMREIAENLEQKDETITNNLSSLENRVRELKNAIIDIDNNYKTDNGFSQTKIDGIKQAEWYTEEETKELAQKFIDSPFMVGGDGGTSYVQEAGIISDLGTHIVGVSANDYGYEYTVDGNSLSVSGHYTGLEARSDFEGDLYSNSVKAQIGYAGANLDVSDTGFTADGNIGVARADADLTLGWDDWNVHAAGDAGVLTADGKIRADTGGIGLKGDVSLAHAEAEGGVTLIGTDIDVGVGIGKIGGGIELAWDKIEIELHVIAGAKLSIEFPW